LRLRRIAFAATFIAGLALTGHITPQGPQGLTLCWSENTEPDLFGYFVTFAERHIERWIDCPCIDEPPPADPCPNPPRRCPVYNPFIWRTAFILEGEPTTITIACANTTHSLCYFRHPTAVDFAGNISIQPWITNAVWLPGGCP